MLARNERAPIRELIPLLLLPLLSGFIAVMAYAAHQYPEASPLLEEWGREFAPTRNAVAGAVLFATATGLFIVTARGWRPGILVLLLFTFADLGVYGFRHKTVGDFETFLSEIDVPTGAPGGKSETDYLPAYKFMGPVMKESGGWGGRGCK